MPAWKDGIPPPGPVRLQPLARAKVASLGAAGTAWLDALPTRLVELEQQWSLTRGRSLPGGSASYVVRARTRDGRDAVLKLSLPDPTFPIQVATLRRAGGRGYVALLEADLVRSAVLLESLGPSLEQSRRPVPDRLRLLADTLTLAWQPVGGSSQPYDKAGELAEALQGRWAGLDRPCSEAVVERALACAEHLRRTSPDQLVHVHGDPHPGNLLAVPTPRPGAETGYCFVDPDGFVADRGYDLGVVLRDWSSHLDGRGARTLLEGWCELLAERTGVAAERIWEWAFLERVATGLYVLSLGAARAAGPFLRSAELLV